MSEDDVNRQGYILYSSLFMMFYSGSYRALPSDCFGDELIICYIVEFMFTILPMTMCMIWTNAAGASSLIAIQSAAMLVKLFAVLNFVIEFLLMICEVRHVRGV